MVTVARRKEGGGRWCLKPSRHLMVFIALLLLTSPRGLVAFGAPIGSSPEETTLDVLRDQPGTSPKEIHERAVRCSNITQLSCSVEELEATSVCGSDGRTYSSVCEIKKMSCHGNPVQVQDKSGPCPAKRKCLLERAFQIDSSRRRNQTDIVIPECEADGTYSPVQCHKETGFCWCVTNTGRPIPTTSVQFKRPDCMPQGKVGRRSSRRRLGTRRRGCSTADRSTFSSNLMKIFRDEYEMDARQGREDTGEDGPTPTSVVASQTRRVIEWKFEQLDANGDRWISLRESADLRRMIRDRVQPKACARRFAKYCDLDGDKRISRTEWSVCLGVDINRLALAAIRVSFRLFQSLNTSEDAQRHDAQGPLDGDEGDDEGDANQDGQGDRVTAKAPTDQPGTGSTRSKQRGGLVGRTQRPRPRQSHYQPTQRRHASTASRLHSEDALFQASRSMASSRMAGLSFLSERTEKIEKEEVEEPADCQSARRRAQEQHQMNPKSGVYIPVCQTGTDSSAAVGRLFERVQCHQGVGFCWCADPETGKPIPGTPKRLAEKTDCSDSQQSAATGPKKEVEIKGCTAKKQADFVRRLHATLVSSMIASGHVDTEDMAPVERALRWKFDGLDNNGNKILERKEWKPYRLELKTWKGMRKCGRNFLRSCDSNGDKRITLTEWLNCAGNAPKVTSTSIPNNRRGPNPFMVILDPNQTGVGI